MGKLTNQTPTNDKSCPNLPKQMTHPSHQSCSLSLLMSAHYPSGAYTCNACRCVGNGWNYHCTRCNYDLHVSCALKPFKIKHKAHTCELNLTFTNPYPNSLGFSCNSCGCFGSTQQWLYRCNSCGFDVHTDCTAVINPLPPPQYHQSTQVAGTTHYYQNHGANMGLNHHAPPHPPHGVNSGPVSGPTVIQSIMMHSILHGLIGSLGGS